MERNLELVWHDPTSGEGDSPCIYRTEGGVIIQGEEVNDETRRRLQFLGDGETGVFVPQHVLDALQELG